MLSLRKKLTGAVSQNYTDSVSGELVFHAENILYNLCLQKVAAKWERIRILITALASSR